MNKTKFFSSLLVAVLFATTSVFVSCKDYDDDIKNLQSQIDKKALTSDLDALKQTVATNATSAQNAMAKAEEALKAAQAAQTTASAAVTKAQLDEAIAAVKKAAEEEGTKVAASIKAAADAAAAAQKTGDDAAAAAKAAADAAKAAQETADKAVKDAADAAAAALAAQNTANAANTAAGTAQSTANDAKAAAGTAQSTADDALAKAKEALQKIGDLDKTYVTSANLTEQLEDLKNQILGGSGEGGEQGSVAAYKAAVEELYKAVTSVELIATYSGTPDGADEAIQFPLGALINARYEWGKLDFVFGKQKWTDKFGDKEDRFADADQIIEYTEGKDIRAKQALLVRVNPVNATFTKDQVKLIDSKGRNLDEIITIGEPYRFEGLITRGNTTETGLWVIPVSVVENTKLKDFNLTTFFEREYFTEADLAAKKCTQKEFEEKAKNAGKAINYAVAINNTADEAEGRFVASTYDLAAEYVYFEAASDFNFDLTITSDGKKVTTNSTDVHNRWLKEVAALGNKPGIQSKDQTNAYTAKNPEQAWVANDKLTEEAKAAGYVTPASAAKKESDKLFNTVNDEADYRFGKEYLTIKSIGEKITVSLPEDYKKKAEYWYITYDFKANAVESAPSEWEAWQSYKSEIKGIYTMTRGAEDIDLVINAPTAEGDVIGFRVFAVNYDGSLIDPDGKAFYVKAGEIRTITKTLTAEVMAINEKKGMTTDSIKGLKNLKREDGVNFGFVEIPNGTFDALTIAGDVNTHADFSASGSLDEIRDGKTVKIFWALLKNDKNSYATNWSEVKYFAVGVKGADLKNWLDNTTIDLTEISQVRNDANDRVKYELVLKAKKVMPTVANIPEAYKFIWKPDYDPAVKNALNVYAIPTAETLNPSYDATTKKVYWQGVAGKLKDAVATATYTASAKSGERKIEDYVSGEFLANDDAKKLYNFSIADLTLGKDVEAPDAQHKVNKLAYQTAWNGEATNVEGDNTVAQVVPAAIGNEYNTNLNYVFENISGKTKTEEGVTTWTDDYDYSVVAQTFKTKFLNPIDLLTYSTEYTYPVYKMNADGTLYDSDPATTGTQPVVESRQTSDKIYIKWVTDKAQITGAGTTKVYPISSKQADYLYSTSSTLLEMIKLNSSAANIVLANDAQLLSASTLAGLTTAEKGFQTALYNINNDATTTVTEKLTFEFTGNVGKYIEPADPNAADLTQGFKKKGGANNPTENMEGTVKITGYDCYGKKHTFDFPIVILFDK